MKWTEISKINENRVITKDETITLYHGSKSGIHGEITSKSRRHCDFGKGFYMETESGQPLTLICNYPEARLYTMEADLSGLKILDVEVGLDWALLIAYNRGKMEAVKGTAIYKIYSDVSKGDILKINGRVEKRYDEWQVIVDKIKRLNGDN